MRVLGRSQDPEEFYDAEVDDVGIFGRELVAARLVEDFGELADDAQVAWVSALLGVVFLLKGVDEILE